MATPHRQDDGAAPLAGRFDAAVRAIVEELGPKGGDALLRGLTARLGAALGADACFIAVVSEARDTLSLRASWRADGAPCPDSLPLPGGPCAEVAAQGAPRAWAQDVLALFPDAEPLRAAGLDAYAGVPLRGPHGDVIGVMAALARAPLPEPDTAVRLLTSFAGRVGLELEHMETVARLSAANAALNAARGAEAAAAARFRDIAALSSDWFWETDADHRFSFLSTTIAGVSGMTPDDHVGKTREEMMGDRLHPDDAPTLAALRETLAARQPFRNVVYRYSGPGGEQRWVRISGGPVFDADGCFTGYRGVGGDITELRAAQEEALRNARILREGVEAMGAGFGLYDAEDRLVLCNALYRTMPARCGMARIEPGMTFEQIVRGHIEDGVYESALAHADPEAMLQRRMARHRNPSGRPFEEPFIGGRWYEITEKRTADGGTVIVRTDITALKHAERRLLDAIESVPVGFIMCDPDDNFLLCNQRYRDLYPELSARLTPGVSFAELCELCGDVVDADGRAMVFDDWLRARLERHRNPQGAAQTATQSGRNMLVWESRTSDGGYVGAHVDISAQVLMQEQLARETRRAEAALAARAQFLANMSHELRTPLNAIIGFAELIRLETKGPLDPGYQEFAATIKQSGGFLLSLIVDILDMSKLDAGQMQVHQTEVDPEPAIREAVGMLSLQARKKGLKLRLAMPPALPAVWAERRRVVQIVQNLVSNAVKFTEAGSVTVSAAVAGDMLRLSVADTGRGMTEDEIALALIPFQQVRSLDMREAQEGTGLGLPLVKALTELQGGRLSIESQPGAGATASVTLPLSIPALESGGADAAAQSMAS